MNEIAVVLFAGGILVGGLVAFLVKRYVGPALRRWRSP